MASILCGLAQSLVQIVGFRLLQGMFGAALVPLGQAILLDIYTPEERGSAMAVYGVSIMVGPVLGPVIGGWLTDNISWRWVFYINLGIGAVAFLGISAFVNETRRDLQAKLDWTGFAALGLTIASLQIFLDRGEQLDWFSSGEIRVEALIAASSFYIFLVHTFTAKKSFVDARLFLDRNFAVGMVFIFIVGVTYLASMALMTPYLQTLMDYPIVTAGLVMGPRGIGTMVSMFLVGRLIGRVEVRWLLLMGLVLTAWAMNDMSGWTRDVSEWRVVQTGFVQGAGLGFLFVPLSVVTFTRMGRFDMGAKQSSAMSLLKRLKPARKDGRAGADQMRMLRKIPRLLRFIPGTAQDVRAYFLTLQYWLSGSEDNLYGMARFLIGRFATCERAAQLAAAEPAPPIDYPDVGVYHPRMTGRLSDRAELLPTEGSAGTVGILLLRSYLLAGNAGHYDGVIAALEARGLRVIPAFASGLDARPAIEEFFMPDGCLKIDALVSLTGFSLVGGPAYNDAGAAEDILARLDVPYLAGHPVEFQTVEEWSQSERGLLPVESTIMVAIPELDGATNPMVFGGRSQSGASSKDMVVHPERAAMLAGRVAKLIALRRSARVDRKVAVVLFNFPPNAGNTGTAAYLSVFESLYRVLESLAHAGYRIDLPRNVDELRDKVIQGNAAQFGAMANVHARIKVNDHIRAERHLKEIEAHWGPAPGKLLTDGTSLHILGRQFGNVLVGVQPAFGYEGDPMRLMFEKGMAPTHAFCAFYRYLRDDFAADALLHFGTHGALEFMPGKQTGMSGGLLAGSPDRRRAQSLSIRVQQSFRRRHGQTPRRRHAHQLSDATGRQCRPVSGPCRIEGIARQPAHPGARRSRAARSVDDRHPGAGRGARSGPGGTCMG